jgi:hypothetical protein
VRGDLRDRHGEVDGDSPELPSRVHCDLRDRSASFYLENLCFGRALPEEQRPSRFQATPTNRTQPKKEPAMLNLACRFWNDEQGVLITAELVLVMTITVIGMTVGLSEIQHAVVAELNDVGDAIGSLNQSFGFTGFHGLKTAGFGGFGGIGGFGGGGFGGGGFGGFGGGFGGFGGGGFVKAWTPGSAFLDVVDTCDNNQCMIACDFPVPEAVPLVGAGWWW